MNIGLKIASKILLPEISFGILALMSIIEDNLYNNKNMMMKNWKMSLLDMMKRWRIEILIEEILIEEDSISEFRIFISIMLVVLES